MNSLPFTRRAFLKSSTVAAGASLAPRSWARVAGANGDVRMAVVGLNGRGGAHIKVWGQTKGVRLVALCDIDTAVLERAAQPLRSRGEAIQSFRDLREMLARPDIDAISIATPHHQHALQAIWACQAGKDVYVEKPVSHNIWEGRQIVAAAGKFGRVVQAGTQSRSSVSLQEAVAWVKAGNLGRITSVRGLCYKRRASIGLTSGPQPVPPTTDYNQWLGPAPHMPLRRRNFFYDWHWQWATGNGDLGNQGCHQMDIARWFLGETGAPPRTLSIGGRLGYVDDGETANTQCVVHDYATAPLIFEVRGLPASAGSTKMDAFQGASVGVVVTCAGGSVVVGDGSPRAYDSQGKLVREFKNAKADPVVDHFQNFADVVRSRRMADLKCPIVDGHHSAVLCHQGNISQRLGRSLPPEELRENIKGNAPLAEAFGRMSEHLAANGVDLRRTPVALGLPLIFDPASERFVGNARANAWVSREYRAPFVVPQLA